MSTIFRTLQVNKWQSKKQPFISFCKINATKFGTENDISRKIIYHYMISYYCIIMIRVDSCIIWDQLDCIMQLKKSYCIATLLVAEKVLLLWWSSWLVKYAGLRQYLIYHQSGESKGEVRLRTH